MFVRAASSRLGDAIVAAIRVNLPAMLETKHYSAGGSDQPADVGRELSRQAVRLMLRSVQILLTNDDGIYAPGLAAMQRSLARLGDVSVVAPAVEQSGVGHSITFMSPLMAK